MSSKKCVLSTFLYKRVANPFKGLLITLLTTILLLLSTKPIHAQLKNQWTWKSGSNINSETGYYGTQGIPSASNVPGARGGSITWTGPDGNLWLMGGEYLYGSENRNGRFNDLWKYDISSNKWTWVSGSDTKNQVGTYGTQGVPSTSNFPGARSNSISWTGPDGNLWLMGGYGFGSDGDLNELNDLWKYDISSNEWTWVSGSDTTEEVSSYGTQGVPSATNVPGARTSSVSWTGPDGNLWLMGGYGFGSTGGNGDLNDLWKYDISSNEWTWMSGSKTTRVRGTYGTKGVPAPSNVPGARDDAVSWTGPDGNLWLMGGDGAADEYEGSLNDLWKYNISSGEWAWMSGSKTAYENGNYGTKGVPSPTNVPGYFYEGISWTGPDGTLWLMTGPNNNDLWKYNITSGEWTWMSGSSSSGEAGSYGTQGIPSASNVPGGRRNAISWTGPDGALWLWGGRGSDSEDNYNFLNDLWQWAGEPGALTLDGGTGYGKIPDAEELDVPEEFTLELWVKFNDVDRNDIGKEWMALAVKGEFDSSYGLMLKTDVADKVLRFFHKGKSYNYLDYTWTDVTAEEWYHIAVVSDDFSSVIYIDGEQAATIKGSTGTVNATTDALFIGQSGGTNNYRLDGTIAEIRLWNKVLTGNEIQNKMNLSVSGEEPNLAGAWLPRAGAHHSASDQTGNQNNLFNMGGNFTTDFPPIKTTIDGSEGWRFLAAPGDSTQYGELLEFVWTQGYTGSDGGTTPDPNVFYYDESSHSWESPSNASNTVGTSNNEVDGTGKGILMYVYADDDGDGSDDPFPKTLTIDAFSKLPAVRIPLSYTNSGISGNDGWNLVANPYPVAIYWEEIVADDANPNTLDYAYIWDHSKNGGDGGYQVHYGEPKPPSLPGEERFDGRIPAFQSFWVKAQKDEATLQLTADHQVINSPLYKQEGKEIPFVMINLEGEGFKDAVSVVFAGDENTSREDVPKVSGFSSRKAELFISDKDNVRWMAQHFNPETEESYTVRLNSDITVNGSFELNWDIQHIPDEWSLELEDTQTGKRFDLHESLAYEFKVTSKEKIVRKPVSALLTAPGNTKEKASGNSRFILHISVTSGAFVSNDTDYSQPQQVELDQNYPNPFNPTTVINYGIPKTSELTLEVYNMLGRKVATLINRETKQAGRHSVDFNAGSLPSGLYFYRLKVGNTVISKKLTLIK